MRLRLSLDLIIIKLIFNMQIKEYIIELFQNEINN
jgi:hypothetical protein